MNVIPNVSDNTVAYLINTLPVPTAIVNHQFAKPRSGYRQGNGMKIIDEGIKKGSLIRLFALFLATTFLANSGIKFQILQSPPLPYEENKQILKSDSVRVVSRLKIRETIN
jgi:hypothetical protein